MLQIHMVIAACSIGAEETGWELEIREGKLQMTSVSANGGDRSLEGTSDTTHYHSFKWSSNGKEEGTLS